MQLYQVASLTPGVKSKGVFNPLTRSGTIVIDNVIASVHSRWFLDDLFDKWGLTSAIPAAYQVPATSILQFWRASLCL